MDIKSFLRNKSKNQSSVKNQNSNSKCLKSTQNKIEDRANSIYIKENKECSNVLRSGETSTKFKYPESGKTTNPSVSINQDIPTGKELSWWLKDPLDSKKRSSSHPQYDNTSLYIPSDEFKGLTEAQKQYFEIKKNYFNVVIFFKVGKFYEVYDLDAIICNKILNLQYMNGKRLHSGFPESAYEGCLDRLVEAGYKVGRVEQVETPAMLKKNKQKGEKRNAVKRSLCEVISRGTNLNPSDSYKERNLFFLTDTIPEVNKKNILAGLVQKTSGELSKEIEQGLEFGSSEIFLISVSLIDVSFNFKSFQADYTSKKGVALVEEWIKKIIYECVPEEIFISPSGTSNTLRSIIKKSIEEVNSTIDLSQIPQLQVIKENKLSEKLVKEGGEKFCPALNTLLAYFQYLKVHESLFEMASFTIQTNTITKEESMDNSESLLAGTGRGPFKFPSSLILNSSTIKSLNIDSTSKGSIYAFLNECVTKQGKRLLKAWTLSPLTDLEEIKRRQKTALLFFQEKELFQGLTSRLSKLNDFERFVVRLNYKSSFDDGGAIFYSNEKSAQLIETFMRVFDGYAKVLEVFQYLDERLELSQVKGTVLESIFNFLSESFPVLSSFIQEFEERVDIDELQKHGRVSPKAGLNKDYDNVEEAIGKVKLELKEYLCSIRSELGDQRIIYYFPLGNLNKSKTSGEQDEYLDSADSPSLVKMNNNARAEQYQLEVPEEICSRVPNDFEVISNKKGVKRFHSPFIKKCLGKLNGLLDERTDIVSTLTKRIFKSFCANFSLWKKSARIIAEVDILRGFAAVRLNSPMEMCMPDMYFLDSKNDSKSEEVNTRASIDLTLSWYPSKLEIEKEFVRNDFSFKIHGDEKSFFLLTGPNMGGKSTFLRQVCLTVILAQLGCFVPAKQASLAVVDKLFTRIGASDLLAAGKSTFWVELEETKSIIDEATEHSLVILDELGRGTSSVDGLSIAYAVSKYFLEIVRCRTLFATHFHQLNEHLSKLEHSRRFHGLHMEYTFDSNKNLVFLYKLREGISEKSFAINVAKMAGLPRELLDLANKYK